MNNVEITLVDKTDPSNPERREEFWRTKLHTLAPLGLNIEEYSKYSPYIASLYSIYSFFVLSHFSKVAIIYCVKTPVIVWQLFDKCVIVILNLVIRFILV